MVTLTGGYYPNSSRGWEASGPVPEPIQNDGNISAMERCSPPLTVARALREHCNIPFESFFLATHLGGGEFAYFSGPNPISEGDIRKMFRRDKFLQFQHRASSRGSLSQTFEDDHGLDDDPHYEDHWPMESGRRKRPRRQGMQRRNSDDAPPVIASSKKVIEIGDSQAVWDFYDRGFKCIQQTACKEVAKAFVKTINPKKQATHPYRKGYAAAPDWWPEPWGPGEKDRCRHVEPDHLWKRERVHVLKHILRLIIEPETQPPSIRKLGVITVAKLEVTAMEALSAWFSDPNKPKNARKRPILKELFKVAKLEEKYKRNEIDGNTQVFVTADDMMDYCIDEDDEDDEESELPADMEIEQDRTEPVTSSHTSPSKAAAMPMPPSLSPTASAVHVLSAQFQATQFLHDMPMRGSQYGAPAMLPPDLAPDQYPYPDGLPGPAPLQNHAPVSLQMHDMLDTSSQHDHHDTSRRSSLFTPTTEFSSSSPSAMYHSPWPSQSPQSPQPPNTAAPSPETSPPLFAYAPAHHHAQHQHHYHPHHHHQQPQQQQITLPALPLPMPIAQQQQQQHQHTNAYQGQYQSGFDGLTQHHHDHHHHHPHHQAAHHPHHHQQNQHNQQVIFRAGNIQLSMQPHHGHGAGGGHGQVHVH